MTIKHSIKPVFILSALLCVLLSGIASVRAEVQVGHQLEPIRLLDQHDQEQTIDAQVKLVIFARDMDGNKVVTKALESIAPARLKELGCVYVADISGMPSVISKMFALPKMRKFPYGVLLDREAKGTKEFPTHPKEATLMSLKELKVTSIRFFKSADELKRALAE